MGAQAPSVAPGPNVYANAGSQNVHSNQAGMKAPQGGGGVVDDGDDDFWGGAARALHSSRGEGPAAAQVVQGLLRRMQMMMMKISGISRTIRRGARGRRSR